MPLRTCTVGGPLLKGVEQIVVVTANSLYKAVAHALNAFADAIRLSDMGHGQPSVSVVVKRPRWSTRSACAT